MSPIIKDLLEKKCNYMPNEVINKMTWQGPVKVIVKTSNSGVQLENTPHPNSNPILYRWLVEKDKFDKLTELLQVKHKKTIQNAKKQLVEITKIEEKRGDKIYYALYFGKSKKGISRITREHLGNDMSKSTLRGSLCGLFVTNNVSDKEVEVDRLLEGSYFEWLELASTDKEYLVCLEAICIALGKYPLNIDGNPFLAEHPDWEELLKESRKELKK